MQIWVCSFPTGNPTAPSYCSHDFKKMLDMAVIDT